MADLTTASSFAVALVTRKASDNLLKVSKLTYSLCDLNLSSKGYDKSDHPEKDFATGKVQY